MSFIVNIHAYGGMHSNCVQIDARNQKFEAKEILHCDLDK